MTRSVGLAAAVRILCSIPLRGPEVGRHDLSVVGDLRAAGRRMDGRGGGSHSEGPPHQRGARTATSWTGGGSLGKTRCR